MVVKDLIDARYRDNACQTAHINVVKPACHHGEFQAGGPKQYQGNLLIVHNRFEYVRHFEREEYLLPNTWVVVRIDGRGFHK